MNSVEEIRAHIGADSLAYLSHAGMLTAIESGIDDPVAAGETDAAAAFIAANDGAATARSATSTSSTAATSAAASAGCGGGAGASGADVPGARHCSACFTGI
jgi:hypothetical protein